MIEGIAKDPLAAIKVSTTKLEDKNLNKMDNDQKAKADTYEKMVERSLISTGNNYRMKKALEKANKGQELTMVYLGGSITEGYERDVLQHNPDIVFVEFAVNDSKNNTNMTAFESQLKFM